MKKKFYLLIIFLLTIFSAWLAKTPYYYETRIRDFNPDIIFKDDIDVKQLDITIDFSNNQIVDEALLGKVTTNYIIDKGMKMSTLNISSCLDKNFVFLPANFNKKLRT